MFSLADIADALEAGIRAETHARDDAQSVQGIDALDELGLHPILARALAEAGYGVSREQRYPADRATRRENEGERCDLVLTPEGRLLLPTERRATLFDDPEAVGPDDALWLEVKVVAQFEETGANGGYTSQLLAVPADVRKLSRDRGIAHAGLLLVLFVHERAVADHDLAVWHHRCLDRDLPLCAPYLRYVPITDRLGNRLCVLGVYGVGGDEGTEGRGD